MLEIGKEFARLFADEAVTRVVTVESSGIAPATMTALVMRLPLVIMKKYPKRRNQEGLLETEVYSFTKNQPYILTVKREFIHPGDRVLLIDDFLANGEAAFGAIRLIEAAGGDGMRGWRCGMQIFSAGQRQAAGKGLPRGGAGRRGLYAEKYHSIRGRNAMTLSKVKCFLLDMDGTFYLGGRIIPGSLEFIRALENTGRSYLFLTNNSSHNAQFYQKRLEGMGLSVPLERILTSGSATAALIRERYAGKRAFVLGNEYLLAEFEEAGVPIDQQNPDLVVIGYDTTLDYKKMTAVCDFVARRAALCGDAPRFQLSHGDGLRSGYRRHHGLYRGQHGPPAGIDRRKTPCGNRQRGAQAHRFHPGRNGHGGRPAVYRY